jgi:hypothetical protein
MKLGTIISALLWFTAVSHACTLVEGDRILGKDLAVEHAAFAGIDPQADLGPAPAAGTRRTLQYFELERIAKERAVVLETGTSREACFVRASVRLNSEILLDVLSSAGGVPDIEIIDFSRNALPVGKPQFRADGLSASGLWRGRWLYGENRSVPIWARVQVTGRTIPHHSASQPEIKPGDTVRVEVRSGGVLLAFEAAAESSGHVGEPVTVRNPANGQRFRAVVEDRGKVGIRK